MRCFLRPHDPMPRQKRDNHGTVIKPHTLVLECRRCGQDVGETALASKWGLLAKLRRQSTADAVERRRA